MSFINQVSHSRLKAKGIFCSHIRAVSAAGRINCLCFDKTGTLTEDGLTLKGINVVEKNGVLGPSVSSSEELYKFYPNGDMLNNTHGLMSIAMAACHAVALVEPEDLASFQPITENHGTAHHRKGRASKDSSMLLNLADVELVNFRKSWKQRRMLSKEDPPPHEKLHDDVDHEGGGVPPLPAEDSFVGDSLEVQMFLHSGWRFLPRPTQGQRPNTSMVGRWDSATIWSRGDIGHHVDTILLPPASVSEEPSSFALAVLRRLDFDAELRRMGVLVARLDAMPGVELDKGQVLCVVKGAPEGMVDICRPQTVPPNFHQELDRLTGEGYRVLGCAARWVDRRQAETCPRFEIEKDMTFVGFMSMENPLKKETVHFLKLYSYAALKIYMITGDNPQTAAAVGRMAGTFLNPKAHSTFLVDVEETTLIVTNMIDSTDKYPLLTYLLAFFDEEDFLIPPSFRPSFSSNHSSGSALLPAQPHDLVVTGRAFELLSKASEHSRHHEYGLPMDGVRWTPLELLLCKANIYARMSPQVHTHTGGGVVL